MLPYEPKIITSIEGFIQGLPEGKYPVLQFYAKGDNTNTCLMHISITDDNKMMYNFYDAQNITFPAEIMNEIIAHANRFYEDEIAMLGDMEDDAWK